MKIAGLIVLLFGGLLLGVGLYFGASSVNRDGTNCGSGFGGVSTDAISADYLRAIEADNEGVSLAGDLSQTEDDCKAAVSDRHTLGLALSVPGGMAMLVGLGLLIPWSGGKPSQPGPGTPPGATYAD